MQQLFLDIHKALHDPNAKEVMIPTGEVLPILVKEGPQKLRYVLAKEGEREWEVVQQNPSAQSHYAARARNKEKISWIIPRQFGFRMQQGWRVIQDTTLIGST